MKGYLDYLDLQGIFLIRLDEVGRPTLKERDVIRWAGVLDGMKRKNSCFPTAEARWQLPKAPTPEVTITVSCDLQLGGKTNPFSPKLLFSGYFNLSNKNKLRQCPRK